MITYKNGESYSVLDDDSGKVLLFSGSGADAIAVGADLQQLSDATVYYPSLSAILAAQASSLESQLGGHQQLYATDKLSRETAELKQQLAKVTAEIGVANKREKLEQVKKEYNHEHERLVQVLKGANQYDDPQLAEEQIEKFLATQPIGISLREEILNG